MHCAFSCFLYNSIWGSNMQTTTNFKVLTTTLKHTGLIATHCLSCTFWVHKRALFFWRKQMQWFEAACDYRVRQTWSLLSRATPLYQKGCTLPQALCYIIGAVGYMSHCHIHALQLALSVPCWSDWNRNQIFPISHRQPFLLLIIISTPRRILKWDPHRLFLILLLIDQTQLVPIIKILSDWLKLLDN